MDLSGVETGLTGKLEIEEGCEGAGGGWETTGGGMFGSICLPENVYGWLEGACGEILLVLRGRLGMDIKTGFKSNGNALEYQGR